MCCIRAMILQIKLWMSIEQWYEFLNISNFSEIYCVRWVERLDEIRLKTLDRVGIVPIVENMGKTRFRWFEHVERRLVCLVVRWVYQIEDN